MSDGLVNTSRLPVTYPHVPIWITSGWPTVCPEPWSSFPRSPFLESTDKHACVRQLSNSRIVGSPEVESFPGSLLNPQRYPNSMAICSYSDFVNRCPGTSERESGRPFGFCPFKLSAPCSNMLRAHGRYFCQHCQQLVQKFRDPAVVSLRSEQLVVLFEFPIQRLAVVALNSKEDVS